MSKHVTAPQPAAAPAEDIGAMLKAHPGMASHMRNEADKAVTRCRMLNQAPRQWIEWKLKGFQWRINSAVAVLRGDIAGIEEQTFPIYRDCLKFFSDFEKRYSAIGDLPALRALHAELDREMEKANAAALFQAQSGGPVASFFNARDFINALAARGIGIGQTPDGDLQVHPKSRLTDSDRSTIRVHLAEMKAALAEATEVF